MEESELSPDAQPVLHAAGRSRDFLGPSDDEVDFAIMEEQRCS